MSWLWCECAHVSGRVICLTAVQQIGSFSVNIWEEQHGGSQVVTLSLRHTRCLFMYWGHKTGHADLTVGIAATLCCLAFLWSSCMQTTISGSLSPRHGASLRLRMEERPELWRVAANILNKQSRTADKGWYSRLGCWARCRQLLTVKTGLLKKYFRRRLIIASPQNGTYLEPGILKCLLEFSENFSAIELKFPVTEIRKIVQCVDGKDLEFRTCPR